MRFFTTLAALVAIGVPGVGTSQQVETPTQPGTFAQDDNQAADNTNRQGQNTLERREAGFRGTQDAQFGQQDQRQNKELVNFLAAKLHLANQCEIATAKMASQQAESQEVKDFANKLQQAHQQLNSELTRAMPELQSLQGLSAASGTQPGQSNRSGQLPQTNPLDRRASTQPQHQANAQSGDQFLDGSAKQLYDITRRTADNAHSMTKEMLSEKQGKQFDMCFVAQQIGAHTWMLAELEAIRDTGPPEFSSLVQQSETKVKQHLDAAKQLAKKLEGQQNQDRNSSNEREATSTFSQN